MKKIFILTCSFIIMLVFSGCGEPALKVSSDEAYDESINEIYKSLTPEQKKKFDLALNTVVVKRTHKYIEDVGLNITQEEIFRIQDKAWNSLNEMTYRDSISGAGSSSYLDKDSVKSSMKMYESFFEAYVAKSVAGASCSSINLELEAPATLINGRINDEIFQIVGFDLRLQYCCC